MLGALQTKTVEIELSQRKHPKLKASYKPNELNVIGLVSVMQVAKIVYIVANPNATKL